VILNVKQKDLHAQWKKERMKGKKKEKKQAYKKDPNFKKTDGQMNRQTDRHSDIFVSLLCL
jgi:hypothetical protein